MQEESAVPLFCLWTSKLLHWILWFASPGIPYWPSGQMRQWRILQPFYVSAVLHDLSTRDEKARSVPSLIVLLLAMVAKELSWSEVLTSFHRGELSKICMVRNLCRWNFEKELDVIMHSLRLPQNRLQWLPGTGVWNFESPLSTSFFFIYLFSWVWLIWGVGHVVFWFFFSRQWSVWKPQLSFSSSCSAPFGRRNR